MADSNKDKLVITLVAGLFFPGDEVLESRRLVLTCPHVFYGSDGEPKAGKLYFSISLRKFENYSFRLTKWAEEAKEEISMANPGQISYVLEHQNGTYTSRGLVPAIRESSFWEAVEIIKAIFGVNFTIKLARPMSQSQ